MEAFNTSLSAGFPAKPWQKVYEFIGLPEIADIFKTALSLLPHGKLPENWPEAKRAIENKDELFDQLARQVVDSDGEMIRRLSVKLRAAEITGCSA